MKNIIYLPLLACIFLLANCKKDSASPANDWSINVSSITDSSAEVSWNAKLDTSVVGNFYQLWINSTLKYDSITSNKCTISKLKNNTRYQIALKAISNNSIKFDNSVYFQTIINYPPTPFTISLDSLTYTSVAVDRTVTIDPEHRKLTYEIRLNNVIISTDQTASHLIINGLQPNQTNTIEISAYDDAKNSVSAKATVFAPPTAKCLLFRHYLNKRECTVYMPSGYSKDNKTAMVIYFHGATGYGWDDAQSRRWREVAEKENIIIAYPQANKPDGIMTGWGVEDLYQSDDLPFARQLIDNLLSTYAIDPKRVYACGMSSGGFMTYYIGMYLTDKLAAIAPVAGLPTRYNFSKRTMSSPLPLLNIHSTKDEIVKYSGGVGCLYVEEAIDFWVKNNKCTETPIVTQLPDINTSDYSTTTLYEYPNPTNGAKVLFYKINGGGHWWPGEKYGETDFVAEDVIWNFFKDIRKP